MSLFKARLAAQREYQQLLDRLGVTADGVRAFLDAHPDLASGLRRSPHAAAGTAADRLAEVAPYIGKTDAQIRVMRARGAAASAWRAARALPGAAARLRRQVAERAPTLLAQAREEWVDAKPALKARLRQKLGLSVSVPPPAAH
jgi:hypothetical protein